MTITDILERNAILYGKDTALVEINPDIQEVHRVTWKEYELIEPAPVSYYRREITWSVFNEKANRFANLLLSRGVKKGDKVAILLMNCLEWLPIYFGILKTGALAVPLNFRYASDEIKYCVDLAEVDILVHLGRMRDKSRKLLEVTEVCGFEDGEIRIRPLYQWQEGKGLVKTASLLHVEKLERAGIEL